MTREQMNRLMGVLLNVSAFLIVLGAIFKLQHWPYGNQILWIGLVSSFVIGNFEISRLKKIIKSLEKKCHHP